MAADGAFVVRALVLPNSDVELPSRGQRPRGGEPWYQRGRVHVSELCTAAAKDDAGGCSATGGATRPWAALCGVLLLLVMLRRRESC